MASLTISAENMKKVKGVGFLINKGTDNFSARIITTNGKITSAQNKCISEAAEKFGNGEVAFTSRLTIECPGIPYDKIQDFRDYIGKEGLETGGTGSKVRPVVSCKGTTCQYGLIDTFELSEKIHNKFYKGYNDVKLPHKFKIGVGGCPNNCMKPSLNDLGIVGQLIPNYDEDLCVGCRVCGVENSCPVDATKVVDGILQIDNEICNNCGRCIGTCHFDAIEDGKIGYKIYIGGRWGKIMNPGVALSKIFETEEEVFEIIEKMILLYREQGITGERVAQMVQRIGLQNIENQLLSNDLFERKDEVLNSDLHLVGGATC